MIKLAVLPDYAEEGWPSMDLVAEMLLARLRAMPDRVSATSIAPKYRRRFGSMLRNADRLLNRFVDYPRHVRRARDTFDCFHVCDHSYAQLVHDLPADRTGVYCHDLDTFRCLMEPERDRRPKWFRAMARRTLRGLQKAAVVFHSTNVVRDEIVRHGVIDPVKLVLAPVGTADEFVIDSDTGRSDFVLHVGSCIARKRIDVLLDAVSRSDSRLVQVGGEWTAPHRRQIERLSLQARITQLPRQPRHDLAKLYQQAGVVVITSDAEGFGLPVIEALACGAVVVASDIPAIREVGGDAVVYCPPGDVDQFAATIRRVMDDPSIAPSREARLARATKFSWTEHARTIVGAYEKLR